MKQLSFSDHQRLFSKKLNFGGCLLKNSHAKEKRYLSHKNTIHVVLRSSIAKGKHSMIYKRKHINDIIGRNAKKSGIKVENMANVGNHIHIMIRINASNITQARILFKRFIRAISGLIARAVLKVERNSAKGIKFWDQRPFTRVVESWTAVKVLKNYIYKNQLQGWGLMPFEVSLYKNFPSFEYGTG